MIAIEDLFSICNPYQDHCAADIHTFNLSTFNLGVSLTSDASVVVRVVLMAASLGRLWPRETADRAV